ncbi:putative metal-binding motif-containing protein [Candidatus Peregrinibacteria bacterium]|nr:putative metal-binding motif-containing protein [Candidatus Peregrinibacteria bacterium]
MKILSKKIISLTLSVFLLGFLVAPAAFAAVECDQDGDGYIVIPTSVMKAIASDVPYNENGNYSPAEWQDYFKMYQAGELTEEEQCVGINFKKGAEPKRCDATIVGANSGVYDPSVRTSPLRGSQVYPGALDTPDNGVDEDCNGKDASLLEGTGEAKELSGLVDKGVTLLSRVVVVVSILVMIWGGVLYSTAAGDEAKTRKARKAIVGAVIGLIIGLLAPTVVNWIAANLV